VGTGLKESKKRGVNRGVDREERERGETEGAGGGGEGWGGRQIGQVIRMGVWGAVVGNSV